LTSITWGTPQIVAGSWTHGLSTCDAEGFTPAITGRGLKGDGDRDTFTGDFFSGDGFGGLLDRLAVLSEWGRCDSAR
jgi:hypothetical protein